MILSAKAKLAGVMGWPVGHSLSPRLHGFWLERYGIDGAYVPLAVAPDNLAAVLRALPLMGIAGVNVTVPHKQAALAAVGVPQHQGSYPPPPARKLTVTGKSSPSICTTRG